MTGSSADLLRAAVDTSPIPMSITRWSDGLILHANAHLGPMFGLPSHQMVGRSTTDFYYDPADRKAILGALQKHGHIVGHELRVQKADGTPFWIVLSVKRTTFEDERAVIAGFYDITERRAAEEALRTSEARLRAFANAVPDIAFILDEDGRYVEVLANPGKESLLYEPTGLKGRLMHDVLPKSRADLFLSVVRATLEKREPQVLEYILDVPAGRHWFEGRTALLSVANEKPMVVWVSHDIAERRRAEEALRKAREELEARVENIAERGDRYGLTFRELTVLSLVARGKSDKEVATLIGLRPRTVSKHVENIRVKMSASSRTEAGVRAVREGIVD